MSSETMPLGFLIFCIILFTLEALFIIYITVERIVWYFWKKKCERELVEDLRKIKEKYEKK